MAPVAADQVRLGIALILASVFAMALGDAVVKWLSADLTLWQVFIARSLFALPWLGLVILVRGQPVRIIAAPWVVARSALLVLTWVLYYAALTVMDLSVAAVVVYTNPVLTTLFVAVLLREPVVMRQWLGVMLGFVGVLVILRPAGGVSWAVVLPLLAAATYSAAMILTRTKCRAEEATLLAASLHGSFIVVGAIAVGVLALVSPEPGPAPFLLRPWAPMAATDWLVMAGLGILSAGFFLGVARAYQIAPPQIIATFDYGYLVSAAIWGYVFFAETLDGATIAGMVLITAAGLLAAGRR